MSVVFWSQRILGEIALHPIDAAFALDRGYEIEAPLAAAAIDGWLQSISSSAMDDTPNLPFGKVRMVRSEYEALPASFEVKNRTAATRSRPGWVSITSTSRDESSEAAQSMRS